MATCATRSRMPGPPCGGRESTVAEACSAPLIADFRDGPNARLFEEVESLMASFVDAYRMETRRLEDEGQSVLEKLAALNEQLAGDHARQEQQYRELVAQSDVERQHAAERASLQKRHLFLTRAQHDLAGLRQKHKTMEVRHRKLMGEFSGLRDKRFALRKEVADRLSQALAPMVRVSVRQAGDRSTYEAVLKEMLKGCGLQYMRPVMRIVETVSPEELSRLVRKGDAGAACRGCRHRRGAGDPDPVPPQGIRSALRPRDRRSRGRAL